MTDYCSKCKAYTVWRWVSTGSVQTPAGTWVKTGYWVCTVCGEVVG